MKAIHSIPVMALLTALGGCSVGPNHRQPKVAMPSDWGAAGNGGTTNSVAILTNWWAKFEDPALDSLIQRAVQSNHDLKAAEARVRAARAAKGAALADFFPSLDGIASYTKTRRSENAQAGPINFVHTDMYQLGFDASWELDVFGGKRRAFEAANASLAAVNENRRDVLVTLLAEVAANYIDVRGFQRRVEIARKNIVAQAEAVEIAELRLRAGLASELDVAQAKTLLAATRSQVPTLDTWLQAAMHRLGVLLGQPPGALKDELTQVGSIPASPPSVPVGLPSDLLRRRPDVRRSERQLAAATAEIGVAIAELFPKFSLTGIAGYQSLHTSDLIMPASKFWTAGPSVRWRLFEMPKLQAQVRVQTAEQEAALAEFQQTVLVSLEEVENALVAYGKEQERRVTLGEAVEASRRAVDIAHQQYTKGLGDFLNVVVAERALYESEDQFVNSERTVALNLVSLYKALGGGWESELNASRK